MIQINHNNVKDLGIYKCILNGKDTQGIYENALSQPMLTRNCVNTLVNILTRHLEYEQRDWECFTSHKVSVNFWLNNFGIYAIIKTN